MLKEWFVSTRNHIWHCSKKCGGDVKKMKVNTDARIIKYYILYTDNQPSIVLCNLVVYHLTENVD